MFSVRSDRMRTRPSGATSQFDIVMNQVPIMDHPELGPAGNLSLIIKKRAGKSNVKSLPLPGSTGSVD